MSEWTVEELADFEINREIAACCEALKGIPANREEIAEKLAEYEKEMKERREIRSGPPPSPVPPVFLP